MAQFFTRDKNMIWSCLEFEDIAPKKLDCLFEFDNIKLDCLFEFDNIPIKPYKRDFSQTEREIKILGKYGER